MIACKIWFMYSSQLTRVIFNSFRICWKTHLYAGGNGESKSSYPPPESLKLVQAVINNDPSKYDETQRKTIKSLMQLLKDSNDTELMNELVNEVDEDGS